MTRPFLDIKERYERAIKKLLEDKEINESNKKTIREFIDAKASEGVSLVRTSKIISNLNMVLKNFTSKKFLLNKTTEKELRPIIAKIEQSQYEESTKVDLKLVLKQYYKWQNNNKPNPLTDFFKTTLKHGKHKIPDDLLTKEEVEKMITACKNNRDKALIKMLYESGARVGELGMMKIKHVVFDDNGIMATIPQGKTGARRIRLIESERYLRNWLQDHPYKNNSESFLWLNLHEPYENVDYGSMRMIIVKKAILANVKTYATKSGGTHTRVHPHLFRHSRATELAKHLTEQQMKVYLGWTQSSKMAGVYVHLSGADMDNAILEMNGIKQQENRVEDSIRCQSCGRVNPSQSKVCGQCLRPLSIEVAAQIDKSAQTAHKILQALLNGEVTINEIKEYAKNTK
jgi:integrase/recombinase XerD